MTQVAQIFEEEKRQALEVSEKETLIVQHGFGIMCCIAVFLARAVTVSMLFPFFGTCAGIQKDPFPYWTQGQSNRGICPRLRWLCCWEPHSQ